MPDLICTLEDLPAIHALLASLDEKGISIRRPDLTEQEAVKDFISKSFHGNWAQEVQVAFYRQPVTCFVAICQGALVGFAAYECTRRGYFGPMGVAEVFRGKGVGLALLFSCLHGLRDLGYFYAVIGAAGPVEYYAKACGASVVPFRGLGIYRLQQEPRYMDDPDFPSPDSWPSPIAASEEAGTSQPCDMLCSLVRLPKLEPLLGRLQEQGIHVRRPNPWEQDKVKAFLEGCGKPELWQECAVTFARMPVSCFVAIHEDQVVGLATYECLRGYVNHIHLADNTLDKGVAMALLFATLHALQDMGYTYATIAKPQQQKFFEKACGAVPLEFSNAISSSRAVISKHISPSLRSPRPYAPSSLTPQLPTIDSQPRLKKLKVTPRLNSRNVLPPTVSVEPTPAVIPDSEQNGETHRAIDSSGCTPGTTSKMEDSLSGEEEGEGTAGQIQLSDFGVPGVGRVGNGSLGRWRVLGRGQGGPGKMKKCATCKQFRGLVPHPRKGACPYCLLCGKDTRTFTHTLGHPCPTEPSPPSTIVEA